MKAYLDTVETPAGPLTFAVNEEGALVRAHFEESDDLSDIEDGLQADGYEFFVEDRGRTARLRKEISEYCAGERREFTVPVAASGTPWQMRVWEALRRIPFGETRSYAQVAEMVGSPGAARAVGGANGCNRVPLVVPCHRVISADGSLGGFSGGLHLKQRLLEHERRAMS
ncbi:MAG: methylated-DNA--[protein]-cysteine S-methyltransferase [Actinomycetota bacterium]|nr:methylated-DNA--[protein]-cysteine S-methyltransferase [Actinomycetota bacterium]